MVQSKNEQFSELYYDWRVMRTILWRCLLKRMPIYICNDLFVESVDLIHRSSPILFSISSCWKTSPAQCWPSEPLSLDNNAYSSAAHWCFPACRTLPSQKPGSPHTSEQDVGLHQVIFYLLHVCWYYIALADMNRSSLNTDRRLTLATNL